MSTQAPTRAIAVWIDHPDFGRSVYSWPQACTDNRRSRVIGRMERFDMTDTADLGTLRVFTGQDMQSEAHAYADDLIHWGS